MGIFKKDKNNDANRSGSPIDTIPGREYNKLAKEARRHGCDSVAELITAESLNHPWEYDPKKGWLN